MSAAHTGHRVTDPTEWGISPFGVPWPAVFTILAIVIPLFFWGYTKLLLWFIRFVTREIIKEASVQLTQPLKDLDETISAFTNRFDPLEDSGKQLLQMLQDFDTALAGFTSRFEPIHDVGKQLLQPLQNLDEAITALATRFDPLENLHASVMSALSVGNKGGDAALTMDSLTKVLDKLTTARRRCRPARFMTWLQTLLRSKASCLRRQRSYGMSCSLC